jgi:uncharacterized protein YutE (UPF0331/DUF86 family)
MNNDLTLFEKQFIDIIAAEYMGKGYVVERDAPLEFLPGFRADLLVEMGEENKVIEIKTRPSLMANPGLREIKRIIDARPGWRFELRVVGEPERVEVGASAQPLDETGVLKRLEQSEKVLSAGLADAAFLMVWAAVEGVLRMMVAAEGVAIERATNPAYILGMAVAHGSISRDDYDHLVRLMEYRNAIAHGFEVDDFDPALVAESVAAVKSLLREYHDSVSTT